MKARALCLLVLCASMFALTPAAAQQDVQYQRRGNRSEGIKPKPVSGYDIELLSTLVDTGEDMSRLGPLLGFRFYLHESLSVHPVVRELEFKHYYVMDNVQPATTWQVGQVNAFEWPTGVVLGRLGAITAADLGIVVRLGKATPSVDEHVAPAVFYQSSPPARATGYVFTFTAREDGVVTARVFPDGQDTEVFNQRIARQPGGRPFVIKWDLAKGDVPEGRYRLVLSGYFLGNNKRIQQTVTFYHRQDIARR